MIKKIVTDTKAVGQEAMDMILSEALNAINEMSRHGGFAPVQWVFSKMPRTPGTQGDENEAHDIGTIQAHVDAPTAFAMQSKYRFIAQKVLSSGIAARGCSERHNGMRDLFQVCTV